MRLNTFINCNMYVNTLIMYDSISMTRKTKKGRGRELRFKGKNRLFNFDVPNQLPVVRHRCELKNLP